MRNILGFLLGAVLFGGAAVALTTITDNDTAPISGLAAKLNDNATSLPATSITSGNIATARLTNAVPALSVGTFRVVSTQLLFVTATATNVIDADITGD